MAKQKPRGAGKKPARIDDVSTQFFSDRLTAFALDKYLASLPPDEKITKRGFIVGAIRKALQAKGAWPISEEELPK